jgi:hypothetical protein
MNRNKSLTINFLIQRLGSVWVNQPIQHFRRFNQPKHQAGVITTASRCLRTAMRVWDEAVEAVMGKLILMSVNDAKIVNAQMLMAVATDQGIAKVRWAGAWSGPKNFAVVSN